MGHNHQTENEYHTLQHRLSQKVQGNPPSPTLMNILRILFSPDEAKLASQLPHNLTLVSTLAKSLGIPENELNDKVTAMARRGILFDLECNGQRYVTLPPVVIGFFEFVFMRARPDIPMKELAHLFEQYFTENDGALAKSFWQGDMQLARTFVQEETISGSSDHSQVLDWERATHIVSTAATISVGMCQCQHLAQHLGTACDKPQEVCLSFGYAAESMVRNGLTRLVKKDEAMDILARCKDANLIQIGDNVQRNVSFICNCCSCCCHMIRGIKTFNLNKGVVSSNWIMEVDYSKCKGCGECVKACPVDAITIVKSPEREKKKQWAVRAEEVCLGCGVCSKVCKRGGAVMVSRPQRILVPETIFDQRVAMALERGKLAEMLFDAPEKLGPRALGRLVSIVEKSSVFKVAMASEPIKSSFLTLLVKGAKKQGGVLTDYFS